MILAPLTRIFAAAAILLSTAAFGAITITQQPTATPGATVSDGTTVNITVAATGSPGSVLTYQWFKGALGAGQAITGATKNKLTLSAVTGAHAGEYYVRISGTDVADTTEFSNTIVITVNVRPKVKTPPKALTVTEGDTASFVVVMDPTGTTPFTFTWEKQVGKIWTDLGAPNSAQLDIVNAQLAHAGNYRVKVTNASNVVVTSATAALKVNSRPVILTQPTANTFIATKGTGTVKVVVGGNAPFKFQWFKGTPGSGVLIPKATAATLTLKGEEAVTATSGPGDYYVEVTNAFSPVGTPTVSTASTVEVIRKPTILTPPSKTTLDSGVNHVLSVVPSLDNTGTLTFQWFKDGKPVANATIVAPAADPRVIAGALTKDLSFTPISWLDRGSYKVTIKNEVGSITSAAVVLTVNSAPIIITQPVDTFGPTGGSRAFSIVAGGSPSLKYEWFFKPVGGSYGTTAVGKAAKLTLSGLKAANHMGHYKCKVTNARGSVESVEAFLQVDDPPKITVNPVTEVIAKDGDPINLTVVATGPGLHYNWFRNNVSLGAPDSATLTITASMATAGTYKVVVTNTVGTATSKNTVVKIQNPPAITQEPVDTTVTEDDPAQLTVAASGTAVLKFQWQKEEEIGPGVKEFRNITGKTAAILKFTAAAPADKGRYRCVVSNAVGTATSAEVDLQVDAIPAIEPGQFYPSVARTGEKVRLFGNFLRHTKQVVIAGASAGFVYETNSQSLLITIPATAPTTGSPISVKNKYDVANQAAGSPTPFAFTRVTTFGNDSIGDRTILTSARAFASGSTLTFDFPEYAYYEWTVPVASVLAVSLKGDATFDCSLQVSVINDLGVTVETATSNVLAASSESVSGLHTTTANQRVLIRVGYNNPYLLGMEVVGNFILTVAATPAPLSNPPQPASADDAKDSLAFAEKWQVSGAKKSATVITDPELGEQVTFGGEGAAGSEAVFLWKDAAGSVADKAEVTVGIDMKLLGVGGGSDDWFAWQIDGEDGSPLGSMYLHSGTGAISLVEPDGSVHESTQQIVSGSGHRFEMVIDQLNSSWTVRMDGTEITEALLLPPNSVFGNASAVWQLGEDGKPSGAVMNFSGFEVTTN